MMKTYLNDYVQIQFLVIQILIELMYLRIFKIHLSSTYYTFVEINLKLYFLTIQYLTRLKLRLCVLSIRVALNLKFRFVYTILVMSGSKIYSIHTKNLAIIGVTD